MGRRKTIDRDSTLRAIETVVRERGFSGLSIDAVAKAAGISKSSVIYDFGSKSALLEAYIEIRMAEWQARIRDCAASHSEENSAWLRGLIDCMQEKPSEDDLAIATIVAAGTGNSDACRGIVARCVSDDLQRVTAQAPDPRPAILAYLAIHGLQCLEFYGFHSFSSDMRQQIREDILGLLAVESGPDHS